MSAPERPAIRPLSAILLAALAVRAAYLFFYVRSPLFGVFRIDQLYYRTWGLEIAAGDWVGAGPFEQAPLYAYLLGIYYRVFGPADAGVLVLQLLAGTSTVLLAAWSAGRLFGHAAGIAAGALAAVYGPLVFYECMLMKTFLEPLFVLSAFAAAIRFTETGRPRWMAAAGSAVGLACLVREVHALLLAPLLATLWIGGAREKARRGADTAALLLAFAAAVAPALAHNRLAGGELVGVSAAGGENAYIAFGPEANGFYVTPPFVGPYAYLEHQDFRDEAFLRTGRPHSRAASSRFWLGEAWRAVRERPEAAAALVARKAAILFADFEVPDSENFTATRAVLPLLRALPTFGWIVGLGFIGLTLAAGQPRRNLLVLGFAATLVAEVLLTFNLGRYRSALVALWLPLAGRGAAWLWATLVGPPDRRGAGFAAAAGVVVLSALSFLKPPGLDPDRRDRELARFQREAAENVRVRDAVPGLRRAVESAPGNPEPLLALGLALQMTGRWHEAARLYRDAARAAPDNPEPQIRLTYLLLRQNRPGEAAPHASAYARLKPDSGFAFFTLGRIGLLEASAAPDLGAAQEALAESVAALRTAVRLEPRSLQARLKLARALHLSGDAAEARAELRKALEIDPESREGNSLASTIFPR
jgi:4-amino-4-deoxy-L-arabinose transferase-like glycosyltransferase